MTVQEFYEEFNQIVANFSDKDTATKQLNDLLDKMKDETFQPNINVQEVVDALEKQKQNPPIEDEDDEDYDESYEASYEPSYEDSYDSSYEEEDDDEDVDED